MLHGVPLRRKWPVFNIFGHFEASISYVFMKEQLLFSRQTGGPGSNAA